MQPAMPFYSARRSPCFAWWTVLLPSWRRLVPGNRSRSQSAGESAVQPAASAPTPADEVFDTVRVDLGDMDALLEGIAETSVQLAGLKTKLAAHQSMPPICRHWC